MELAILAEENRNKFVRLYLIIIGAVFGVFISIYIDNYFETNINTTLFENINGIIFISICLAFLFLMSFVTGEILFSSRKGNTDCIKRVNVIRRYLCYLSSPSEIDNLDKVLLPIKSDEKKYFVSHSSVQFIVFLSGAGSIRCFC